MSKLVRLTIIAKRPRQFATRLASAILKTGIDAFGGVPADAVTPGDLISGLPHNIADPSGDPNGEQQYALPSRVHFPTDDFLRSGDTVFEQLSGSAGVYTPTLNVQFYRNVWFDGLVAQRPDHFIVSGAHVVPTVTLPSDVRVTAKYVITA